MTGKSVIKISLQQTEYILVLISFNNIICNWFNEIERQIQILSLIIEPELRWTSSSRARSRRSSGSGHRKTEESEIFFNLSVVLWY